MESARSANLWCHFHVNGQSWPLLLRHPRHSLEDSVGRPPSLAHEWGSSSLQGHAKGTPTYPSGLIPALDWAFSEPNPSECYVWEIEEIMVGELPTRRLRQSAGANGYGTDPS
jgi:hypothetical protein